MKITVEFESLEEFQKYIRQERSEILTKDDITLAGGSVSHSSMVLNPSMIDKAVEVAAEEVKAEQEAPDPEPEGPVLDENFRLKVRKALASLNKMKTGNPAKKLIEATGYKRLTEVPLELLPGLLEKAEEAMKDA